MLSLMLLILSSLAHAEPTTAPTTTKAAKNASVEARAEAIRTRKSLLEQEIMTLNKNKACAGDGECEAIEVGSRLCGGPSDYLVLAASNPQASSVKQKVKELTAVEKELNLVDPPNDCTPAPKEPDVRCVKEQCALIRK